MGCLTEISSGKRVCQVKKTEDSEVCGLQYGAKTAATSMVAHLFQKHEISVPEYLTEKASQHSSEKQLSVKSMFARRGYYLLTPT